MARFNSEEYGWSDITVSINGITVMACLGISYEDSIEAEHIYGKGLNPIGISDGNRKIEGTLTVHQSELDKLVPAGNAGVTALKNLTIQCAYVASAKYSVRTLTGCRITKIGEEYKQGDKFASIALPFLALDVYYL